MVGSQWLYRYANERLRERVIAAGTTDHRHAPFFCECAEQTCMGRINATLAEFDEAHFTRDHYFTLPGHLRVAHEESIEENGRYDVLLKMQL